MSPNPKYPFVRWWRQFFPLHKGALLFDDGAAIRAVHTWFLEYRQNNFVTLIGKVYEGDVLIHIIPRHPKWLPPHQHEATPDDLPNTICERVKEYYARNDQICIVEIRDVNLNELISA